MTTAIQQKPPGCRTGCGGAVPEPPAHMPNARMQYRCGISVFGYCPAVKSIARARKKRYKHRYGLWRRSRRQYRQRVEAIAILTDLPGSAARWPEGAAAAVRRRAEAIPFEPDLYHKLRQALDLEDAVNEYLQRKLPFTPKQRGHG